MYALTLLLLLAMGIFANDEKGAPNIITRWEWGARNSKGVEKIFMQNPPPFVIIHHSATGGCTERDTCEAKVKSIQNYHMNELQWQDIGYNFLVGEDGNIYEGRGWKIRGVHTLGYNSKSIGICIIGSFDDEQPNSAAITATKQLIDYGVSMGHINTTYVLKGHMQIIKFDCPGQELQELIQTWPHWQNN